MDSTRVCLAELSGLRTYSSIEHAVFGEAPSTDITQREISCR